MKDDGHILFVFGSARSGTTYLNKLLDSRFGYGMGPEGTFVSIFAKKLKRYGDLADETALGSLIDDISRCQMLEIIRKRWGPEVGFDVRPEDIQHRLSGHSYGAVVEAVFRAVADYQGKPRIGNKNPDYWKHLELLESLFPDRAKYVCIVRDGRDVFLSLQKLRWGGLSAYQSAKRWRQMCRNTLTFADRVGGDRLLIIQYEDLLSEPDDVLRKFEAFLAFPLSTEARDEILAESDANPKRDNFRKWKSAMEPVDQHVYEAIAGNELRKFGYETNFVDPRISGIRKAVFEVREIFRLVYVNIYHAFWRLPSRREVLKFEKPRSPQ